MKKILLFFLFAQNVCAQEWQTIPKEYFGLTQSFVNKPTYVSKNFQINPYTNDIWLAAGSTIHHVDNLGAFEFFSTQNVPLFGSPSYSFLDFAFTTNALFVSRNNQGLYRFKNQNWENVIPNLKSSSISSVGDSVYITQNNNTNFFIWYDELKTEGSYPYFVRTAHYSDQFWGSTGNRGFIDKFENNNAIAYDPDTCKLMSIDVYDFKFSPLSGSLFVSGNLGLSVAYQNKFVDSISIMSSNDMPSNPSIIEFEFDNKDNIWALFGESLDAFSFNNSGIAYYDISSRTWSDYYDANNSPIDFTQLLTIEVDTAGNLWVAERDKLHVLKINETPAWLAAPELQNLVAVDLYPNPGTEKLHVRFKQEVKQAQSLKLRNVMGQLVLEQEMHSGEQNYEFSTTTLPQGIYFLDLGAQKQWRKWIKL